MLTLSSQGHCQMMEQFEKQFKSTPQFRGRLEREANKELWRIGQVYQDGETNLLFLAFRQGVAYGMAVAHMS